MPERRKRLHDGQLRLPKVVADLALAERFQSLLDTGEVRNRAELARRFRLTRARVTQFMKLLSLHPQIASYVKSLPPGTPPKMVTERGLRVIVRHPQRKQLVIARRRLRGFSAYVSRENAA